MEERKQPLRGTESRTSTHSRANSVKWKDRVFSPTFHDVQIEQVQIIEPPAAGHAVGVDQKSEHRSDGGRSSAGLNVIAPPPSEEESMGTNNSEERRAFRESYLYQASERVPSRRATPKLNTDNEGLSRLEKRQTPSVPLVSLPLEPPGTVVSRERSRARQQSRQRQSIVEQRQRQKVAILRHMQRLQTNESPQQRRLMSGNVKKKYIKTYYEVSPGVILTELPPEESHPQTAPESEIGALGEPIVHFCENRANTVPHISKSIIWTAKNRVASSRVLSSTSSRWKEDEYSEMEHNKKANVFVKMPFKQCPCLTMNQEKQDLIDDMVRPGYELRLTTAFTVSRVKRGINKLDPPPLAIRKEGRLLKAKLKPLYPVKAFGPTIYSCHGIQPEQKVAKQAEGYTPSPSRQRELKDKLNKFYEEHRTKKEQYEQNMIRAQSAVSRESVHMTSPAPDDKDNELKDDYILNDGTGLDMMYDGLSVSNQLHSLHIESGVIF